MRWAWAFLALAALLGSCCSLGQAQDSGQPLPHVDECSTCMDCVVDGEPLDRPITMADLIAANFMPAGEGDKQRLPVCQKCRGCTVSLTTLVKSGSKQIFGREFVDEGGASSNWLFLAPTNKLPEGKAIVKMACVPVNKIHDKAHGEVKQVAHTCHPDLAATFIKIYLAIEMLAEDCGLTDIIPKVWVEPVNAIIPGVGYHIRWLGLWMEQADGISLENLVRLGKPQMHPNAFLEIMHNLNHTQIIRAAIFDLLTSQCDRHAQNIFIAEGGNIMLIDNERAFYENRWCGIDSILLPTTKKFTINVMENAWVHKFKNWGDKTPQCWANVPLLLDYRCYVEGGKLGTNLPPEVNRCLRKVRSLSVEDLQLEYGLPTLHTAEALRNRSVAMLEHGFEYALEQGYPRNPDPWRYRYAQPCCKIKHVDTYRCAHDWTPDTAIPFGDPMNGGPWTKDWPDVGSYVGGQSF